MSARPPASPEGDVSCPADCPDPGIIHVVPAIVPSGVTRFVATVYRVAPAERRRAIRAFPAHGNQRAVRDTGCRFDHLKPMYR